MGANNILRCLSGTAVDQTCVVNAINAIFVDLTQILPALRAAAGPAVKIIAMNYYDPLLAAWVRGEAGQALALESYQATLAVNAVLENI